MTMKTVEKLRLKAARQDFECEFYLELFLIGLIIATTFYCAGARDAMARFM